MMPVADSVINDYAFKLDELFNTFGEYISKFNIKQLRIAETEKYAHVTYFFDGGVEKNIKGCDRILINSPKVATYDLKPEMSSYELTNKLLEVIHNYDLIVLNFANGDMLGHTGKIKAAIKAIEVVDFNLGLIYKKAIKLGFTMLITADHGNCEEMLDSKGDVLTAHTLNKVPFIITNKKYNLINGKLGDIAPTILKIMNVEIPKEMTGNILLK
jgi:2,3-bisphosphoglycerate-independent phosphoglycerate mutase